jgi:hypothetical protein
VVARGNSGKIAEEESVLLLLSLAIAETLFIIWIYFD